MLKANGSGGAIWNVDLTIDEARYLRDELAGAKKKAEATAV